ncbi:hypothetical protein D3C75_1351220 [compost metagenome]
MPIRLQLLHLRRITFLCGSDDLPGNLNMLLEQSGQLVAVRLPVIRPQDITDVLLVP